MKKKLILTSLLSLIIILAGYQITHAAYGLEDTAKAADLMKITDIRVFIGNIIGTILSLVGVIFFVLMLYGGFVWMTARGNAESEKSALGTIMGAVIGIIIVLAAYAITNFVFSNIKSASGTNTSGGTNCPSKETIQCCIPTDANNKDLYTAYPDCPNNCNKDVIGCIPVPEK